MNESIKELAIKAGFKSSDLSYNEFEKNYDLENFAKLIVKDCIDIIVRDMTRDGDSPKNIRSNLHIKNISKRHLK